MVIPGLLVGLLFPLPFLDRRSDREPSRRPFVMVSFAIVLIAIAALTYEGFHTTPAPQAQTSIARVDATLNGQHRPESRRPEAHRR